MFPRRSLSDSFDPRGRGAMTSTAVRWNLFAHGAAPWILYTMPNEPDASPARYTSIDAGAIAPCLLYRSLGPIDPDELGFTSMHEHVLIDVRVVYIEPPTQPPHGDKVCSGTSASCGTTPSDYVTTSSSMMRGSSRAS